MGVPVLGIELLRGYKLLGIFINLRIECFGGNITLDLRRFQIPALIVYTIAKIALNCFKQLTFDRATLENKVISKVCGI